METHFDDVPPLGMQIFWYPRARKDKDTVPLVGFINKGWSRGVADLSVLPVHDGAVEAHDQVWHIGDPRLRDQNGRISPGGHERGCWEFTPAAIALMDVMSNQADTAKTRKKA